MCFSIILKVGKDAVEDVLAKVADLLDEFRILYPIMLLMDYHQ